MAGWVGLAGGEGKGTVSSSVIRSLLPELRLVRSRGGGVPSHHHPMHFAQCGPSQVLAGVSQPASAAFSLRGKVAYEGGGGPRCMLLARP